MISIKGLNKSFWIPHERHFSLRSRILDAFKKSSSTQLHVLKDIDIEISEGECVGIIGRNGCGKSTLLKIIAGIIEPDEGEVLVKGRISPFLELGVGFNQELSVYDNIYLYGSVLGLSGQEIDEKFDSMVEFSGLENFIDAKLKTLSSGMQVRAAFSVASAVDRAIYLADEVLAVGDISFQEKCFKVFSDMQANGKTIVFVSHSLQSIVDFCSRAIWINKGEVVAVGDTQDVIDKYLQFMKAPKAALPELEIDSVILDEKKETAKIGYRILAGPKRKKVVQGTKEVSL